MGLVVADPMVPSPVQPRCRIDNDIEKCCRTKTVLVTARRSATFDRSSPRPGCCVKRVEFFLPAPIAWFSVKFDIVASLHLRSQTSSVLDAAC
jgi:hypothetical protein